MVYIRFAFIAFACAWLCLSALSFADDGGLSQENVEQFYQDMVATNTELREGFEDLPIWIEFLEDNLAEDFENRTIAVEDCDDEGTSIEQVLDKDMLLQIYNSIGISRYKRFEINVDSVEISDDKKYADALYTLIVEEYGGENEFGVISRCAAIHIWDEDAGRARVKSMTCTERVITSPQTQACDIF